MNLKLKKDIVIPAGSIFKCIDGYTKSFHRNNYWVGVGLTKDTSGELIYGVDTSTEEVKQQMDEWFEEVE